MSYKWLLALPIILLSLISNSTIAQNSIKLLKESSSIRVFGTSNVHDWEMYIKFNEEIPNYKIPGSSLKSLKDVQFKIEGNRLKSSESAMEKKAYKALRLTEHPFINFLLRKITIKNHKASSFNAVAHGQLTIAGKTKDIKLPLSGNILGDKKMNLTGHIDLKMSDYEIKAPTAFFGAISTSDDIKILYSLDFSSKQKLSQELLSFNLTP